MVAAGGSIGPVLFREPVLAAALCVAGCLFAAWALTVLGRSFAVLPVKRPLVTAGPYRWVRHPAYLGELVAVLGLCLQSVTLAALLLTAGAAAAVAARIRIEERLLAADPAHEAYRTAVRWRLIPGLW